MAYPMIALTTAGTAFACASTSLTETGLAVLNDDGSRIGFVPYDSLEYVAPTEEARVEEAPITVHVEDGSTFGAASLSQTSAGVAVQNHSGSRVGFVPYDTLTYALPASKTGPTLPADATPPDGVEIDEEDDGGGPVWEGDRERSGEHGEDADAGDEDTEDDAGDDEDDGVWDGDPAEESDRDGEEGTDDGAAADEPTDDGAAADEPADGGEHEAADPEGDADTGTEGSEEPTEETSSSDPPVDETEDAEREEVEESELVVDWSFGENA